MLLLLFIIPSFLFAQDRTTSVPIKKIEEIQLGAKPEEMLRLKEARIAIADYDLLRLDFPEVAYMSNAQIDDWLLSQVAFISKPQVAQTVVNTEIPVTQETRIAQRPPRYGRAIVFEMKDATGKQVGLIDVKGSGSLKPGQVDHGNGLSTLGEAIREYNYENLVRGVMVDSGLPNRTIGSYGVIDAGFDVVHADGSKSRAGYYLRQAHSRNEKESLFYVNQKAFDNVHKTLTEYGIDPAGNIQSNTSGDIMDFGHFVAKEDLPNRDPKKAVPFELWGYEKTASPQTGAWAYSKVDKPWMWGHETAEAFAQGRASRDDIWKHHVEMVKPPLKKLSCPTGFGHILQSLLAE